MDQKLGNQKRRRMWKLVHRILCFIKANKLQVKYFPLLFVEQRLASHLLRFFSWPFPCGHQLSLFLLHWKCDYFLAKKYMYGTEKVIHNLMMFRNHLFHGNSEVKTEIWNRNYKDTVLCSIVEHTFNRVVKKRSDFP